MITVSTENELAQLFGLELGLTALIRCVTSNTKQEYASVTFILSN